MSLNIKDIEEKLTVKYGDQGINWEGGAIHQGTKREKYYAIKAPRSSALIQYKKAIEDHGMKIALNKISKIDQDLVARNLVIDCLIVDPELGVATIDDFNKDSELQPLLVEYLVSVITDLASAGLEGLKKK